MVKIEFLWWLLFLSLLGFKLSSLFILVFFVSFVSVFFLIKVECICVSLFFGIVGNCLNSVFLIIMFKIVLFKNFSCLLCCLVVLWWVSVCFNKVLLVNV